MYLLNTHKIYFISMKFCLEIQRKFATTMWNIIMFSRGDHINNHSF